MWAPGGEYQGLNHKGDGYQKVVLAEGGGGQRGRPNGVRPRGGRRWALGERGAGVGPRLLEGPRLIGPRVGWWGPLGWAPGEVEGVRERPQDGGLQGGWPQVGGRSGEGP